MQPFLASPRWRRQRSSLALDWKFEAPSAPYFLAIDNGHFSKAGLEVEISPGKGSLDAIPKVATGAFPWAFADINSLIKFLDQNPGAPVTAIMMVWRQATICRSWDRKSLAISEPKDLEGSHLGRTPHQMVRGHSFRPSRRLITSI